MVKALLNFVFTQLLPHAGRLKLFFTLLRLYQRTGLPKLTRLFMPAKLRAMDAMLPAIPATFFRPAANVLPAIGPRRARVAMLNGCVMPLLFGDVNEATVRCYAEHAKCISRAVCCGALIFTTAKRYSETTAHAHRRVSRTGADAIVVNAANAARGEDMTSYCATTRPTPTKPNASPPWTKTPENFSPRLGWLAA
jgi:glycolate oxidase iron-sulfur subunit